jgi:hypothetical protein
VLVIAQNLVLSSAEEVLPDGVPFILWDNKVTFSNVTATSEDADYPATNLANEATNQEWRSIGDATPLPTSIDIDIAINSVDLIDAVGIARHNFGTAQIAVTILADDPDLTPSETVLVGPQIPSNDEPLLFVFTERSFNTLTVRLTCDDQPARAAVLYTGKLLRCQRGFDIGRDFAPPKFARKIESLNGQAQRGDYLGEILLSQWIEGATFDFKHFTPDWYRTYFDPFVAATIGRKPFFFAWSPTDYPYEVAYCWHAREPVPLTSPQTGRKSVTLDLRALADEISDA